MSGIFLDNEYTDELGLLYFMDNSIASVLHNTSYNAIILELKLNRGVKSPYLTVEYDETENNLKLKEIKEIVFKIVIISSNRVEIKPLGLDKRTIDLENFNHEKSDGDYRKTVYIIVFTGIISLLIILLAG